MDKLTVAVTLLLWLISTPSLWLWVKFSWTCLSLLLLTRSWDKPTRSRYPWTRMILTSSLKNGKSSTPTPLATSRQITWKISFVSSRKQNVVSFQTESLWVKMWWLEGVSLPHWRSQLSTRLRGLCSTTSYRQWPARCVRRTITVKGFAPRRWRCKRLNCSAPWAKLKLMNTSRAFSEKSMSSSSKTLSQTFLNSIRTSTQCPCWPVSLRTWARPVKRRGISLTRTRIMKTISTQASISSTVHSLFSAGGNSSVSRKPRNNYTNVSKMLINDLASL